MRVFGYFLAGFNTPQQGYCFMSKVKRTRVFLGSQKLSLFKVCITDRANFCFVKKASKTSKNPHLKTHLSLPAPSGFLDKCLHKCILQKRWAGDCRALEIFFRLQRIKIIYATAKGADKPQPIDTFGAKNKCGKKHEALALGVEVGMVRFLGELRCCLFWLRRAVNPSEASGSWLGCLENQEQPRVAMN